MADDLKPDQLRLLLEQFQAILLARKLPPRWVNGVSGPVNRPISAPTRLPGPVYTRLLDLNRKVMALAAAGAPMVTGRAEVQLSTPAVLAYAGFARAVATAPPPAGSPAQPSVPELAAPRPGIITAQRMLNLLIALIAILLLEVYDDDLSAHDQGLLMAAIAIGGIAWQVSDHMKVKPPKD